MASTAGCGHHPVGSRSRERGCRYVFSYAPPKRKSVICFPAVGHAAVEGDFRQEWTHDEEPGLTGTQGGTPLHGIDLRRTRIAHLTPLVSLPLPHVHLYRTIGHLLRLICTILPVVQSLLSSLCAGQLTPTSAPTLVRVAVARGRVLYPECHGETYDMFHFCQRCATPSTCYSISAEGARLSIDEAALGARYTQFITSLENETYTVRREAATTPLGQFLSSQTTGGAVGMATAQPRDIVQFLCWLDSCSDRRRTVVHAMHCTQVGAAEFSGCSTQPREYAKQYAHDFLRANNVLKLAVAYERDLGITTDWSDALRIGYPIRSDLVTQYTFTREEQKKAGVAVKQAPAVLRSHLHTIVSPLRGRLQCISDSYTRVVLARDLVLFAVAFETTKRGTQPHAHTAHP